MRKIPALLLSVVLAVLLIRRIREERKSRQMNRKIGSWNVCPECREYSHSELLVCDNQVHFVPIRLHSVSTMQTARVITMLSSPLATINLPSQEEYYAFGSFFLTLEETTLRKWDSASALLLFLLAEDNQARFYDLMKEYVLIVPEYKPSGLVTLWLTLHAETAKVMER